MDIFSLILIILGLCLFVVREFTLHNIDRIKKYAFIKNGAMYSILALGGIMVADAFGMHIDTWVSPVTTFAIVGYFFVKSVKFNSNGTKLS